MKSKEIAAILSTLNDECGRLNDLMRGYPSAKEWEPLRLVMRAYDAIGKIRAEDVDLERLDRFNGAGGALSCNHRSFGAHPDRCECQGNEVTPHRHYGHAPYSCARCPCEAYVPVKPADATPATSQDLAV